MQLVEACFKQCCVTAYYDLTQVKIYIDITIFFFLTNQINPLIPYVGDRKIFQYRKKKTGDPLIGIAGLMVGRDGFEPPKADANRFTVCPF